MRIVFISDTHGKHGELSLPEGELLIHAGDISGKGLPWQVREFMEWFGELPHPHKVLVAGNHDFMAETDPQGFRAMLPPGVTYLENSGAEVEGIKLWGSPITPFFYDWAFNRKRGAEIAAYWDRIPEGTDILVTHGPPFGALDRVAAGECVGCEDLARRIETVKPKIHVFGHIHEAHGTMARDGVLYVNASVLDLRYRHTQDPIVLDWPIVE